MARELAKVLAEIQLQTVGKHPDRLRDWKMSRRLDDVCR